MVWLPVSLKYVDTDGSILGHIGVENLGEEEALAGKSLLDQNCHKKFGPPFNCSPRSKYFEVLGPLATRFRVRFRVRVGN